MATKIQIRRDTAANWTSVNPVLAQGELAMETDTGKFKLGDGATVWTSLAYQIGPPGAQGAQGAAGGQGSQGVLGAQGAIGAQGVIGAQGAVGAQGVAGAQGTAGAQGAVGAQGTAGAQGVTGAQGATGTQGAVGVQGAVGAQGTTGSQGVTGAQGTAGVQGSQGSQGSQGTAAPSNSVLYLTTAGAPTSGTYVTGQIVVDSAGVEWKCTAGGTPGTWAQSGAYAAPLSRSLVTADPAPAVLWGLYACDTTGGTFAVTLPAASGGKGRIAVKWVAGAASPTIGLTGSDHLNTSGGPTTGSFAVTNQGYTFESDGSGIWTVTSDDLPLSGLDARYVLDSTVTAKGDLLVATASGTVARLAVGSNTQVLTADSTQTDGMKWAAAGGGVSGSIPAIMASGNWTSIFPGANAGGTIGSNQALLAFPFCLENGAVISGIGVSVNTAGATGSTIRLGIYSSSSGLPASLLIDFGTVAGDSTGIKSITPGSPPTLAAGTLYWLAYCVLTSGAVPNVLNSFNSLSNPGTGAAIVPTGSQSFVASGSYVLHSSSVAGALPATFTPAYQTNGRGVPVIALQAQ